jgi:hypothetical protein
MDGRTKSGHDGSRISSPEIAPEWPINACQESCGKLRATAFSRDLMRPTSGFGEAKSRQTSSLENALLI